MASLHCTAVLPSPELFVTLVTSRLQAAAEGFLVKYGTWPTVLAVPGLAWLESRRSGTDRLERLRAAGACLPDGIRLTPIPGHGYVAMDGFGRSFVDTDDFDRGAGFAARAAVAVDTQIADGRIAVRPIPNSYIAPGALLAAGETPGSAPGRGIEEKDAKLARFLDAGFTSFIDLTPSIVGRESYGADLSRLAAARGIDSEVLQFAVTDAPEGDDGLMARILDAVDDCISRGRGVYLHCQSGLGATGMVLGCWMVRHGWDAEVALDEIWALSRSMTPSHVERHRASASPKAEEQRTIVREWAALDPLKRESGHSWSTPLRRDVSKRHPTEDVDSIAHDATATSLAVRLVAETWASRHDSSFDTNWESVIVRGDTT